MKQIKKMIGVVCLFLSVNHAGAQELFTYTEPASNMPTKSLGIRLTNNLLDEKHMGKTTYQFLPELMWGANKNLMIHAEAIMSNSAGPMSVVGAGTYIKYRFLSNDEVHRHFRMAAFGRAAYNQSHVHYQELETNGMNTGGELGLIATQLLHKQAISASLSYEQITDNGKGNTIHPGNATRGVNYSLSTGRLILPAKYTSYKQTNFNVMLEVLGQYQPQTGQHYVDIAPSLQFIIHSQTRIDVGFRQQMQGNLDRMATTSFLFRVEHLLFNVL
ncbi:MAG TPA: hypothetical protein VL092_06375 [Chitinophagaceae bacterium]|nr:hypothetical protein [Chitinophagaceae bacterium]